jgi:hypothetical protein
MRNIWSKAIGIKGTSGLTGPGGAGGSIGGVPAPGMHGADLEMLTQQAYQEQSKDLQRYDETGRVPPPTTAEFIKAVARKFLMWGMIVAGVYAAVEAVKFIVGLLAG